MVNRHYLRHTTSVAALIGFLAVASAANAQDTTAAPAAQTDSAAATAAAPPAQATPEPTAPAGSGDIVVTGSRIARRDYVAESPIITQSQDALKTAGVPTVDAALTQLPQFQPGSGGYTNQSQGGLGIGQATVNLRGLEAVRTLVLLDGRRLQPGNGQNVIDINTIPSSAIENVEIITGGASATYGSDAIAGVVNFKLRNHFDGLELDGQSGISDRGDAGNHQLSFIYGHRFGDKASFMVAGEYADRDAVGYRDRKFSTPTGALSGLLTNGYYAPSGSNLPNQTVVNSVFATYGVAPGTIPRTASLAPNADGTLFRSGSSLNYKDNGNPCTVVSGATVGYDGFCTNQLQGALKRYSFISRGDYQLTPDVNLYVQGIYAHSFARGQGSDPALLPAGASGLSVPVTNPFIPSDLQEILASRADPTANFTYTKRFADLGPRRYSDATTTYQIVAGANGDIGSTGWTFDLYGSHGETRATDRSIGSVSVSAAQQLLSAADGGASLCDGGFDIFGPDPVSADCAAYVRKDTVTRTRLMQNEVSGNVSGTLFNLPAGELKTAITADYRENTYRVDPDAALQAGDIASVVAVQPTRGKTKVAEIAVEFLIPIIKNAPLIKSLNFTPGYRYSKYSPGGGASTYKLNLDWRVVEPLLLRGGYQRAVRAPNIGELYLAPSGILVNIGTPPAGGDPCDVNSSYRTGANAASVRSLCVAQGVPNSVVDTFTQANGGIQATSQGNPDLKPETANTYTIGGVLQPRFLGSAFDRFNLSVDYYNIKIKNVIGTLSVPTSISKCFNGDGSNPDYSADNFFCSNLTRNPDNGQIVGSRQTLLNLGGYRTSGIDFEMNWALPEGALGVPGAVTLNANVNYLSKFEIQALPGTAFQDYTGTISSSSAPGATQAYPKTKISSTFQYAIHGVEAGIRWRHLSSFKDISTVTNPASTVPGPKAYDYFDLFGRIGINDQFELRAGVTNLFDRDPPTVGTIAQITNLGTYDAIGRSYYVGFHAKF